MIELISSVILAAVANWAVIEALHHGEIFERPRAWLEAHDSGFFITLLLCPYCLSHWTALPLTSVAALFVIEPHNLAWHHWLILPVLSLAATRLSNGFNDVFYRCCRTPRLPAIGEELSELQDLVTTVEDVSNAARPKTP